MGCAMGGWTDARIQRQSGSEARTWRRRRMLVSITTWSKGWRIMGGMMFFPVYNM